MIIFISLLLVLLFIIVLYRKEIFGGSFRVKIVKFLPLGFFKEDKNKKEEYGLHNENLKNEIKKEEEEKLEIKEIIAENEENTSLENSINKIDDEIQIKEIDETSSEKTIEEEQTELENNIINTDNEIELIDETITETNIENEENISLESDINDTDNETEEVEEIAEIDTEIAIEEDSFLLENDEVKENEPKGVNEEVLVYWTPNGKTYHSKSTCRTLSRSKIINSGTIYESGKDFKCENCK